MSRKQGSVETPLRARVKGGNLSASAIQKAFPTGGFFAGKQWLLSPEPLVLSPAVVQELSKLGHRLRLFQSACDVLYLRSKRGSIPGYVCDYLDAGKPAWMLEHSSSKTMGGVLPPVIRPDILLAAHGMAVTELDSVPGGIGLTAWLSELYADAGWEVLGGMTGMVEGFRSLFSEGGADIVISEESADYRPEMEWLVKRLGSAWKVRSAESYDAVEGRDVYRFFELFDHHAVPAIRDLARMAEEGKLHVAPPIKPHLEEKLWAALFWLAPLEETWIHALRGNHLARLREIIPYSWVVDSTPLPHTAVLPRLGVQSWDAVGKFSQKDRELVLKISGFSELAWGSRGVSIGHDLSREAWSTALTEALTAYPEHPYVLQEFRSTDIIQHPYWDPKTGERRVMEGRVRLCPYYFSASGAKQTPLGGVLATIVPADKKLIHGMGDAIIVPCVSGEPES